MTWRSLFHSLHSRFWHDLRTRLIKREHLTRILLVDGFPHRDNSLPPCRETERGKMPNAKSPCEVKHDLLIEYLSTLEQLQIAQWEHKEILTIGVGDGLARRSAQLIEAIKSQCRAASAKYTGHCRAHHCPLQSSFHSTHADCLDTALRKKFA